MFAPVQLQWLLGKIEQTFVTQLWLLAQLLVLLVSDFLFGRLVVFARFCRLVEVRLVAFGMQWGEVRRAVWLRLIGAAEFEGGTVGEESISAGDQWLACLLYTS